MPMKSGFQQMHPLAVDEADKADAAEEKAGQKIQVRRMAGSAGIPNESENRASARPRFVRRRLCRETKG